MKILTLLFLRQEDQVLLAMKKRGFGTGKWNGVGGKVENGESIEAAMRRECSEEIGVNPTNYQKTGLIEFNEYHDDQVKSITVHVFICDAWKGEPLETEEMAPKWYKLTDIPYDNMWDDDKYWLPNILSGNSLQAEFTLSKDNKVSSYTISCQVS